MEIPKDLDLEDKLLRRFQIKDLRKSLKEQLDQIDAEIEDHFAKSSIDGDMILQLPNGEWAVITKKGEFKEKLDKSSLANELLVSKDELKTERDISLLTEQGRLSPKLIDKHTEKGLETKLSIRKRKTKPKKKG
ncbi:hypothetical protein [Tumebacillus flagellatus]|uniref:Uncharacterized protein n=1 Tax=Tumebacillus flagellatus TaxID=1157490 RepID=A0A074LNU2_9BACL|nr:hypothetical protein [Tumebacillus flagellatus]KEO81508.1 hypothetical protein EL26_20770 [Tumebacillus flagellatus]